MKAMRHIWISLFLSVSTFGFGQDVDFKGGSGNGSTVRSSSASFISGDSPLNYFGGNGRGNTMAISSILLLDGGQSILSYPGGQGDGHSFAFTGNISLGGSSTDLIFPGGAADGSFISQTLVINLDGSSLSSLNFTGGAGGGSFLAFTQPSLLTGNIQESFFLGGISDGSDVKFTSPIGLGGDQFVYSFLGGQGRGNIVRASSKVTLNGVASAGFARVAVSTTSAFRGTAFKQSRKLFWKTENSESLDHFVVESSPNGIDFSPIGFVQSRNRNDQYSFSHGGGSPKEEFFRLLEVFNDSSFSYSNILKVAVNNEEDVVFNLYPNPVLDELSLQISKSGDLDEISIFDHSGKLVYQGRSGGLNEIKIKTLDFSPGLYWLEVKNETVKNRIRFTKL